VTTPYRLHEPLPAAAVEVLVVSLSGWIDASGAAGEALDTLHSQLESKPLATFDDDVFIDYRARRPTMTLRDGVNEGLTWHVPEMKIGADATGRLVAVLSGPEPDSNWRLFAATVADLCVTLGVRHMVGLGAYPMAAPHTRPAKLSCTSPSAEALAGLAFVKSSVDVPAGMEALLEHELHRRGIRAIGLWAQVPHYVTSMAYPAASVALIDALCDITGLSVSTGGLRPQAVIQQQRIDGLVAANAEHQRMVAQLEEAWDLAHESGEHLAAELEQFLRDQDLGS
jgi:predicted ATP-grasp superfamily ATP-dependent carboligase